MSQQSAEIKDLAVALNKAQAEIRGALKDSKNPFFKSNYADLESVWEACRAALNKNGLSVAQTMDFEAGTSLLVTTLLHNSGQWIRGRTALYPVKNDSQAIGSAITYSRRYALAAMVGVIQVDDDGNAATHHLPQVKPEQPAPTDGFPDDSYRIPFGKFAKRSLEEVGPSALASYVSYLEKTAQKEGKPMRGDAVEFITRASEFIANFENAET